MKACILTIVDQSRLSMVSIYTEYLKEKGIKCDVIFYDKYHEYNEADDEGIIPMHIDSKSEKNAITKIFAFWKKKRHLSEIIAQNGYDLIIIWNEVTAFIYSGMLKKEFSGRYIINIRDYFYFDNPVVKLRLKQAIKHCYFATVSSKKYIEYLPSHEYITLHSYNKKILSNIDRDAHKQNNQRIRILYLGQIGWLENTLKFVDCLGNNDSYDLLFYGVGSEAIEVYAREKGYKNVRTIGKFPPEKTMEYLKEADIIYNLYGYGNRHLDLALSIKLYYAIYLTLPILTFADTATNEIAEQCGIAYTIHGIDNLEKELHGLKQWYDSFNITSAREKCKSFIETEVNQSHKYLTEKLNNFFEKSM